VGVGLCIFSIELGHQQVHTHARTLLSDEHVWNPTFSQMDIV